jgi:hypothetical protein
MIIDLKRKVLAEKQLNQINQYHAKRDFKIESPNNFKAVFFNFNDSVYDQIFTHTYENSSEEAFLISTAYHFVSKQQRVLKDIDASINALQETYRDTLRVEQ